MNLHRLSKIDWRSSLADLVVVNGSPSHGEHELRALGNGQRSFLR